MKAQDRRKAYALLKEIVTQYRAILGGNLVGMYLHGSLAFDCFRWEASDIDFLVVVQVPPSPDEKLALLRILSGLERSAPPKGFEMSVVLERECLHFRSPTPFELHYSNAHAARFQSDPAAYCATMHGTDPDLAAHFTVIRSVGRAYLRRLWRCTARGVSAQHSGGCFRRGKRRCVRLYRFKSMPRAGICAGWAGAVQGAGRALGAGPFAAGGCAGSLRRACKLRRRRSLRPGRRCFPSLRPFYAQQDPFAALSAKKEPRVLRDSLFEYR